MNFYLTLALILAIYFHIWFAISLLIKRNDIADIAWGLGFVLLAWSSVLFTSHAEIYEILIAALVTIWGLRLSWHIFQRNNHKPEDKRYAKWRQEWGKYVVVRSYFQVYLLQGLLLFIISLPVMVIIQTGNIPFNFWYIAGSFVWIFGFIFESIADKQLAKFIKNSENKGKIMQQGLWSWSRHPNYFGEILQWWGIWIITLNVSHAWWLIISPILITFLITKVSGIPMLEEHMANKEGFEEYQKDVSILIPLRPKKK